MDKSAVVEALIRQLRDDLNATVAAQRDAADYATDEESRAREKYETQSTEASYLARGQAAHAEELATTIQFFEEFREQFLSARSKAASGALVEVELGGFRDWFFLATSGGGHSVKIDGKEVTIVTRESPIGGSLWDCSVGYVFSLPNGSSARILQVL